MMSDTKELAIRDPQEVAFEVIQRKAKLYSSSELVPKIYQGGSAQALANCVIALNIARRIGADELMVMQNLYVVQGRPSWSSTFVISALNSCKRFTPIRFDMSEDGVAECNGKKMKNLVCRAITNDAKTGEELAGPAVSMVMAIAEGWYGKNGSKWQTMPELMIRYRAAAFFGRLYAPDVLNGMHTVDEVEDFIDVTPMRDLPPEEVIKTAANAAPSVPDQQPAGDAEKIIAQLMDFFNSGELPAQATKEIDEAITRNERDPIILGRLLAKAKAAYKGAKHD